MMTIHDNMSPAPHAAETKSEGRIPALHPIKLKEHAPAARICDSRIVEIYIGAQFACLSLLRRSTESHNPA